MKISKLIGVLCITTPVAVCAAEPSNQNWDGLYIGAKAGYAKGDTNLRVLDADESRYPDFAGGELIKNNTLNSGLVGAEMGYYVQHNDWVYGVFGSTNLLNASDTKWSNGACCGTGDDKFKTKLTNISIIGGRVGYAVDKVLIYAGAGAAFGRARISVKDNNFNEDGSPSFNYSGQGKDSKWLRGYALNAGVDYALDSSWKLGLEYTYVEFKHKTFDATGDSFGAAGEPQGKANYTFSTKGFDNQLLAISLKYTF